MTPGIQKEDITRIHDRLDAIVDTQGKHGERLARIEEASKHHKPIEQPCEKLKEHLLTHRETKWHVVRYVVGPLIAGILSAIGSVFALIKAGRFHKVVRGFACTNHK